MNKDNKNPKKVSARMWLVLILSFVLMFTLIYVSSLMTQTPIKEVSFNEFMTMVEEEKVVGVEIGLGYADKFTFTDADGNVYKTDNVYFASASLPYDNWLISKILSFGGNVKIISPQKLKDDVKKMAENIAISYK